MDSVAAADRFHFPLVLALSGFCVSYLGTFQLLSKRLIVLYELFSRDDDKISIRR